MSGCPSRRTLAVSFRWPVKNKKKKCRPLENLSSRKSRCINIFCPILDEVLKTGTNRFLSWYTMTRHNPTAKKYQNNSKYLFSFSLVQWFKLNCNDIQTQMSLMGISERCSECFVLFCISFEMSLTTFDICVKMILSTFCFAISPILGNPPRWTVPEQHRGTYTLALKGRKTAFIRVAIPFFYRLA